MSDVSHRGLVGASLPPSDSIQALLDAEAATRAAADAVLSARLDDVEAGGDGSSARIFHVTAYGAVGDGVTDDRVAIQAAIDAAYAAGGGTVWLPNATYIVSKASGVLVYYCLHLQDGVRVQGESQSGCIIKQQAGIGASVRLFYGLSSTGAAVSDITLDGNKSNQSVDEHRAGIFADGTTRLLLERMTCQNFTGDGISLYTGCAQTTIRNVLCQNNDRDGVALIGTVTYARIMDSQFLGNAFQQIDFEPGSGVIISDIVVSGNVLDALGGTDYAIAIGGSAGSDNDRARRIVVANNTINGGALMVWADDVVFANNSGVNATSKSCVEVYRLCKNIRVVNNEYQATQTGTSNVAGMYAIGTGGTDAPENILFHGNKVSLAHASAFGIRVEGAKSCTVSHNILIGAGGAASLYAGVLARATATSGTTCQSINVFNNRIRNFGNYGVRVAGSTTATLDSVSICHNDLDDDGGTPHMTTGVRLYDGSGTAASAITLIGNKIYGGCTTPVSNYPTTPILIGGNAGSAPIYSVSGTPEAAVTAPIGSMAVRRDGGANTTLYIKESGTGNTGWVAK